MDTPFLRIEDSGEVIPLRGEVTTVGRGRGADIRLDDPSVSRLHAELIRRGPYVYVADLGLSRNGTRVNGRPVARRVLDDGDVLSFGTARCRIGGLQQEDLGEEAELRRPAAPELTRREFDVLTSLCRPALSDEAFALPAMAPHLPTLHGWPFVTTRLPRLHHLGAPRLPALPRMVSSATGWLFRHR